MMRRTPVVLAGALALITLGFATLGLVSLMAHERTRTPVSFATGITTIELSIGAGDVVLNGSDRPDVSGVRTIDRGLARPTITEERDGSTLRLRTSCKSFFAANCSVRYELDVPKGVRITGSSSGGGIRINGATGPVDVSSSGGGVTVAKSSGPLTVSSSGGGIQILSSTSDTVSADSSGGGIRAEFAEPPNDVNVSSSGGGVTVVVPNNSGAYNVDASSSGGGTRVDVRTDPVSQNRIKVRSSGGGVTVTYSTAA